MGGHCNDADTDALENVVNVEVAIYDTIDQTCALPNIQISSNCYFNFSAFCRRTALQMQMHQCGLCLVRQSHQRDGGAVGGGLWGWAVKSKYK